LRRAPEPCPSRAALAARIVAASYTQDLPELKAGFAGVGLDFIKVGPDFIQVGPDLASI
jgi:hypothetical protein